MFKHQIIIQGTYEVADPGRGPGPPFFQTKLRPEKNVLETGPPGLDNRPPYHKVWILKWYGRKTRSIQFWKN